MKYLGMSRKMEIISIWHFENYTLLQCVEDGEWRCSFSQKKKKNDERQRGWRQRWRLYPNNSDKVDAIITIIMRNDIGL